MSQENYMERFKNFTFEILWSGKADKLLTNVKDWRYHLLARIAAKYVAKNIHLFLIHNSTESMIKSI